MKAKFFFIDEPLGDCGDNDWSRDMERAIRSKIDLGKIVKIPCLPVIGMDVNIGSFSKEFELTEDESDELSDRQIFQVGNLTLYNGYIEIGLVYSVTNTEFEAYRKIAVEKKVNELRNKS